MGQLSLCVITTEAHTQGPSFATRSHCSEKPGHRTESGPCCLNERKSMCSNQGLARPKINTLMNLKRKNEKRILESLSLMTKSSCGDVEPSSRPTPSSQHFLGFASFSLCNNPSDSYYYDFRLTDKDYS